MFDGDDYFELMIRNAWHIAGGKGAGGKTREVRVLVTHLDGGKSVECVEDDEARLEEGLVRIQAALAARQLDRWQPQTFIVVLYVLDSLVQFVKHIH